MMVSVGTRDRIDEALLTAGERVALALDRLADERIPIGTTTHREVRIWREFVESARRYEATADFDPAEKSDLIAVLRRLTARGSTR